MEGVAGRTTTARATVTRRALHLERYQWLFLAGILLIGAALRLRGLAWDGDQHLHPDERFLTMVAAAIRLPASLAEYFDTARSPLNPYNAGFNLFVYGTAPLFFVRTVAGLFGQADYGHVYLVGRGLSVLADLVAIAMVFLIGRRIAQPRVGLLAAALYAFAVFPIQSSHFFTVDAFTNVPFLLVFWFCLDIAAGRRWWAAFGLTGAAFGLLLASRINLVIVAGVIGLAVVLRLARAPDRSPRALKTELWQAAAGLLVLGAMTFAVFRVAQPYAFVGPLTPNPQLLDNMATISRQVSGEEDYPPGHQWAFRTPYVFPWWNMVRWGLGLPFGLAAWAGLVTALAQILRSRRDDLLLMAAWVLGAFLFFGDQFVMTMRYLLPLYPFMAVFAAYFLFAVWDWIGSGVIGAGDRSQRAARAAGIGLFVVVVAGTVFWATAFVSIYTRANTRVAASHWILANIPDDAVLATEHWDDALPLRVDGTDYYGRHKGIQLTLYDADTPEKRDRMLEWLDGADYIVLSSNRLAGSIPRLPMRYPLTTRYYGWLFGGQLGFARVQEFTSYPQLFGVTFNDDSAEEQFTVYDHPKVQVFRKTAAYSHAAAAELLNSVDLAEAMSIRPAAATASHNQYRMNAADQVANAQGGTWNEIFNPDDLANRLPVLVWVVMLAFIGVAPFPLTFFLFHGAPDRGYAFARLLGILFVAWFAWSLSSYHILPFSRWTVLLGLLVMVAAGALLVRRHRLEFGAYVRTHLRLLAVEELVFWGFFALSLAIRNGNPDLWHPHFGGEKPMDFAYLNAILKTTWLPPYNPWFAGSFLNYYYFGQFISAALVRLAGIVPEVAYNLLLPTFFGLTASGAFGVASHVVAALRRDPDAGAAARWGRGTRLGPPVAAGLLASLLVLLIGNLGQVSVLGEGLAALGGGSGLPALARGLFDWWALGKQMPVPIGDWYWTATRVIPQTINEFPFFSFLYGDLHAHLLSLPLQLLALGLATAIALNRSGLKWYALCAAAFVLGGLRATNTWDYPTYLGLTGAAIALHLSRDARQAAPEDDGGRGLLHSWLLAAMLVLVQVALLMIPARIAGLQPGADVAAYTLVLLAGFALHANALGRRLDPYRLVSQLGWRMVALAGASYALFLPYVLDYSTAYSSVGLWSGERSALGDYLKVHGIFIFISASYLLAMAVRYWIRPAAAARTLGPALLTWGPLIGVGVLSFVLFRQWLVLGILLLILLGVRLTLARPAPAAVRWIAALMTLALLLTLTVEVLVLKGDIGRTNTVFKFYLQAWVLFGVAGAAGLVALVGAGPAALPAANERPGLLLRSGLRGGFRYGFSRAWLAALGLLLAGGLLYPALATPAKILDRFVAGSPPGLNGMAALAGATYDENGRTFPLAGDLQAIGWMRRHVAGSPVIAEGNTGLYRWGSRFSIYTGLPTIIGWDWHTKQQYALLPGEVIDRRLEDVRELYDSPDSAAALQILRRYGVSYVIVGALERAVYSPDGLGKFEALARSGALREVYGQDGVRIYEVMHG